MVIYTQSWTSFVDKEFKYLKIVAITGSVGCGKTTLAGLVKELGYVVYDVDAWVARLYYQKDFIAVISNHFPTIVQGCAVNKRALRNIVFSDNKQLKLLESLIHPFLKQTLKRLIRKNKTSSELFFIDIALLFEMGWQKYCDYVILAYVDYELQKKRVMERDNISAEDFEKINKVQLDMRDKEILSDIIIDTDKPKNILKMELIQIIEKING